MKCFLDIDGVLADFVGQLCNKLNVDNPYTEVENRGTWDIQKFLGDDIWDITNNCNFWTTIPKLPDAEMIVEIIDSFFGDNVCLLSSPTNCPECAQGKVKWIQNHFPQYKDRYLLGRAKHFCASPNAMLIDDCPENIEKFVAAGGCGLLLPRPYNHRHGEITLRVLVEELNDWCNQQNKSAEGGLSKG